MFAELTSTAGPLGKMPRAEAIAAGLDNYTFTWSMINCHIPADATLVAKLYISREGGRCVGERVVKTPGKAIPVGRSVTLQWHIVIPSAVDEDSTNQAEQAR